MAATLVTTWHLEMRDPAQLRPAAAPEPPPPLLRVEQPLPAFSRFLYTAVGGHWYWRDRLGWSQARWQRWLQRPELETWVLYDRNAPAGYFELELQAGDDVEIAYFGLLPECVGRGLGGHLLTEAIRRGWAMGRAPGRRVWVHTCSLDGPHALANYEARGLQRYREDRQLLELPARSPGPWPGWDDDDGT